MRVAERIPAPEDLGDLRTLILPSRACLLSVRDLLCIARRAALEDSLQAARRLARKNSATEDQRNAAALEVLWETVACLELAANVAAPWVDPQLQSPSGAWVEMTRYDPGRANRFYGSSHKWTDERFAVLSTHRFRHGEDTSMLDTLIAEGMVDERMVAAFAEAEVATTRFLRERFEILATAWKQMRSYAAAYEHGLLLVPSDIGEVVDEDDRVVPHAILVWETRKDASRGQVGDSVTQAIDAGEQAGELAIDLAHHVADARLRVVEALEFDDDGVYLRPWEDPFPYWFRRGDVSNETLALLERNVRIAWITVEDSYFEGGENNGGPVR
jgi:hypothetical protein